MNITIYELPAVGGGFIYRAFAGALRSDGRTAGEALDRVAAQFPKDDATPLVILQHRHGDRFFPATKVERLERLMARGASPVMVVPPFPKRKAPNWISSLSWRLWRRASAEPP